MTRLVLLAIARYQQHLSAHTGATCRYQPSCSVYAQVAYARFGFVWGSLLTARRLFWCSPWGTCGPDPVPERADGRPDRPLPAASRGLDGQGSTGRP